MKYFERFVSNTYAESANQSFFNNRLMEYLDGTNSLIKGLERKRLPFKGCSVPGDLITESSAWLYNVTENVLK